MTLYAAYGSNMDPLQMLLRAPHSPAAGTGWLTGWRLTFGGEDLGWEGALVTLVESDEPGTDETRRILTAVVGRPVVEPIGHRDHPRLHRRGSLHPHRHRSKPRRPLQPRPP